MHFCDSIKCGNTTSLAYITKNVLPNIVMFQQMKCINFLDPDPLRIPSLLFCEQSADSLNRSSEEKIRRKNPNNQPKICAETSTAYTQEEESQNGNSEESPWQSFDM